MEKNVVNSITIIMEWSAVSHTDYKMSKIIPQKAKFMRINVLENISETTPHVGIHRYI